MSANPACFENIIGISRTPCPCVEDLTVEATTSASGLYLDELDGINLRFMDAGIDCGQGTLWEMAATAIEGAMGDTQTDLLMCLGKETEERRKAGISEIGSAKKATGSGVTLGSTWHGITVQPAQMKGGTFEVTHIAAAFKETGDVTVYVYDEYTAAPIATFTVPAVANVPTWYELPTPLELSMSSLGDSPAQYWFVYRPDEFTGVQPLKAMATKYSCSACGEYAAYWSRTKPQYLSANSKGGKLWADWSQSSGVMGSDITERYDWTGNSGINETQGIMLRVKFACDKRTTFCADEPDYLGDEIQNAIAHAVRFKAAANLVARIFASTAINRYAMTAGETLAELRKEWLYQYDGITKGVQGPNGWENGFVCTMLSDPKNVNRYGDCLKCKDHWGMRVGSIRS